MSQKKEQSLRQLSVGDVRSLESMLRFASYNCRNNLKYLDIPFKGSTTFNLNSYLEPTLYRSLFINDLIRLKTILNEIDLGELIQTSDVDNNKIF